MSLYLTGAGAVSPAIATGAAPAAGTLVSQLPAPVQARSVSIGGVAAVIEFAGIPTSLVGVMQINVRIPATAPLGTQSVIVTIGGVASVAGHDYGHGAVDLRRWARERASMARLDRLPIGPQVANLPHTCIPDIILLLEAVQGSESSHVRRE